MKLDTHQKRFAALPNTISTPLGDLQPVGAEASAANLAPKRQARLDPVIRFDELRQVFTQFGIKDGDVLSFHHHYRNGDRVINAVLAMAREQSLKDLTIAPSSLFPCHDPLVPLIEDGTIRNVVTDYMKGEVADAISQGKLAGTAILQSHGGRARAISTGQLKIDVAFVGAPIATLQGDLSGRTSFNGCGPLGYPAVDAAFARHTVGLAGIIADETIPLIDIPGEHVDGLLEFADPGSSAGIKSGATVPSISSATKRICETVVDCIDAAGLLEQGLSIQSGAGGYSIATIEHIGQRMRHKGIEGQFISGGITKAHVDLLEAGLFKEIKDVQCFDLEAVLSAAQNASHHMMTAEEYASPLKEDAVVNELTVILLGALEIDQHFNVNAVSGGNGRVLGGPGGHPDTAEGAKLSIVTTELVAGGYAKLAADVRTVTTLGDHIDLLVTEEGVAVNPKRNELKSKLSAAGIPIQEFEELRVLAEIRAERPTVPNGSVPRILIESRHGQILDWL